MWADKQCLEVIRKQVKQFPDTLVMLGSGWSRALEDTQVETRISYQGLFGVKTSVPGHIGELVVGELAGKRVAFMAGRFHLYEGYTGVEATTPIRVFAQAGVKKLVVTSASGALNPDYQVGDIVVLPDLLTIMLRDNPLSGPQFVDMSGVFDPEWRAQASQAAEKLGMQARSGIYAYVKGPHFETPADKRAILTLGADCVGMSTVPEVLQARALELKILGISLITNLAFVKHDHKDVLAAANQAAEKLAKLIACVV